MFTGQFAGTGHADHGITICIIFTFPTGMGQRTFFLVFYATAQFRITAIADGTLTGRPVGTAFIVNCNLTTPFAVTGNH